ncbi:MAG: YehS family protein [Burkholderiales bacterium]
MPNNNDVLRGLRYALDLPDALISELLESQGHTVDSVFIAQLLRKEEEPEFLECDDALLSAFLDGLIVHKRGPRDTPAVPVRRLTNNIILKKIRIAFDLKESDLHEIFGLADFKISRPELSAIFRNPDNKNYRACGDQLLRYFLKGLSLRLRG